MSTSKTEQLIKSREAMIATYRKNVEVLKTEHAANPEAPTKIRGYEDKIEKLEKELLNLKSQLPPQ